MTLTAGFDDLGSAQHVAPAARRNALAIWPVAIITLLAVFVISLPNLIDPFIRHDDYPALFAEPEWFWMKTLNEGRWLNYIWHLREVVTPAWLNFAVYQALWAILSAAIAVAAMGRAARPWFVAVLALLILVASPAILISIWFNTLIPGLAIVTLYAVLGCKLPQSTHRALLPVFVVVTFWAYTTYPLILLAVCLMRAEHRSLRDLVGLMALFVASFAAAILLTYTLNWQVHGVFGVPLDVWRAASPAADMAGMIANLPKLSDTFYALMVLSVYSFVPAAYFLMGLLAAATVILIRRAPLEALYLYAGLLAGMALIVLQVLKLGVQIPPRTFIFAWIFCAVIIMRAASHLGMSNATGPRMMRNLTLLTVLCFMLATFKQYTIYRPWQAETQALGEALIAADPDAVRPVLVHGDTMALDTAKAAYMYHESALTFRIRQLTGHKVLLCDSVPAKCTAALSASVPTAPIVVHIETRAEGVRLGQPIG